MLACLLPDRRGRWSRDELIFLAWTRETGVVPAALAGIIVGAAASRDAELVVICVALAIIVTLSAPGHHEALAGAPPAAPRGQP